MACKNASKKIRKFSTHRFGFGWSRELTYSRHYLLIRQTNTARPPSTPSLTQSWICPQRLGCCVPQVGAADLSLFTIYVPTNHVYVVRPGEVVASLLGFTVGQENL